jgi:hypothetical protein
MLLLLLLLLSKSLLSLLLKLSILLKALWAEEYVFLLLQRTDLLRGSAGRRLGHGLGLSHAVVQRRLASGSSSSSNSSSRGRLSGSGALLL